ncbi:hypothetical protein Pcinc_017517 [Petrolisthes cinctipes]|uniref:Uncharacterized protein n=1 Tax=Petrolisthes cinctipes TaxID=88211 RepID=A0AAE1FP51_PETCI|nr:hypothetical protein Pcinc_044483 [Petrolisthes cinctipes]KAK3877815.1 hypothetical protein Pcinc_017517 [Petrolisthes cinctipes]
MHALIHSLSHHSIPSLVSIHFLNRSLSNIITTPSPNLPFSFTLSSSLPIFTTSTPSSSILSPVFLYFHFPSFLLFIIFPFSSSVPFFISPLPSPLYHFTRPLPHLLISISHLHYHHFISSLHPSPLIQIPLSLHPTLSFASPSPLFTTTTSSPLSIHLPSSKYLFHFIRPSPSLRPLYLSFTSSDPLLRLSISPTPPSLRAITLVGRYNSLRDYSVLVER